MNGSPCRRCLDSRRVCKVHPRYPAAAGADGHDVHEGGVIRCPVCCPVAFGIEISENRKHAAIVAAGRSDAGRIAAQLAWYEHPRTAVRQLSTLYGLHEPVDVVLDPKSQSVTLLKPLAEVGVVVSRASAEDVAVAHGEFMDLVTDGDLEHLAQQPLTAAVKAAQTRPLAGAQALERRLGVDQAPLVAAELGVWAFRRWEEVSDPGVWQI